MDNHIKITADEQAILNKAIELLQPFDKEEVSQTMYYFEVKGHEVGSEYDTCNNKYCIKISKATIRKNIGKYTRVAEVWTNNDSDHEIIESCSVCFNPLNDYLTWIANEFEHHVEHTLYKEDITSSRNAFDLRVMFNSFPSSDHKVRRYIGCTDEGYAKQIKRQEDFKNSVINYAKYVIEIITP